MATTMTASSTILAHTQTAVPSQSTNPPIVEVLRFLSTSASVVLSVVVRSTKSLSHVVATPLSALLGTFYHPILYMFAPALLFLHVALDVFVWTPYSIVTTILSGLYPIYVFVGATCICAACIGLAARISATTIKYIVFPPKQPSHPAPMSSKPQKRVSIKEEHRL